MLLTVREDASVLQRQSEGVGEGLNMQNMDIKGRGDRYSWRRPIWICVVLELNNSVLNDEMIKWTLVNASVTIPTRSTSQLLLLHGSFFSFSVKYQVSDRKKKTVRKKNSNCGPYQVFSLWLTCLAYVPFPRWLCLLQLLSTSQCTSLLNDNIMYYFLPEYWTKTKDAILTLQ